MWTEKQKEAIDKRNSNILVSASAGSGKTAVLVERVINRVIDDNVDINKLLIVTFTNASASELKERLLKRIYEALDKDKSNAFLKRQIQNINISNIETIHSFCLKLIRSNFDVLEIDPNIKIVDESYSNVLKIKAINNVLEKLYIKANKDDLEKEKLYKFLELFSSKDDKLTEYILKIYSYINSFSYPFDTLKSNIEKYNQNLDNIDLVKTDFGKEIYDDVISSLNLLLLEGNNKLKLIEAKEDFVKIYEILDSEVTYIKSILDNADSWDKLYTMLNNFSFSRMSAYKGEDIDLKEDVLYFRNKILKKEIEDLKKQVYETSSNILNDNKIAYEYVSYMYDIIFEFDKKYSKLKQDAALIDFNDIEHLALKLLVKKDENGNYELTEIAKQKRSEFEEIYTDEYQDTSMVQETILQAISNSNNRFMVGDVKQSIYKFRQAMPEIFNEKYKNYEVNNADSKGSVKILLNKNFRSRKQVIDSINKIFEKIMSDKVGNCNYSESEKLEFGATLYEEDKSLDYRAKINVIDLKDEEESNKESNKENNDGDAYLSELKNFEIEARMVLEEIKNIVGKFNVYDVKEKKFHKARYKDIVILLRSIKDKGMILENVLKENGIPVFCDVSSSIFESDEIKLVLSLLKVIDNPIQDVYMVSVMYSIIGNFTLDEMLVIKSLANNTCMYNSLYISRDILKDKLKNTNIEVDNKILLQKIEYFITFLEEYINIKKIYSVSKIILKLYKETNIYNEYLLEKDTAKMKKANLNYLVDIAINYENNFDGSLSTYLKYVESLKDKVDSGSATAKIISENEDVVRIMTIHKSKGLEFPVVMLCDTTRKYNIRDTSDTIVMESSLGIGVNVVKEDLNITYPSVIKQAIKNKIVKDSKSEELRMLYVALTRAKEKLIIFGTLNDYEKFIQNQKISIENGKVNYKIVEKNSDYFSNILLAISTLNDSEKNEYFDVNILNKSKVIESIKLKDKNERDTKNLSLKMNIENFLNGKDVDNVKVKELSSIIENNLDFKYKYLDDVNLQSRVSVSELKRKENNIDVEEYSFEIPECINENKIQSGANYGTTMHKMLMYIDYNKISTKEDLQKYIENLISDNVVKKESVTSDMIRKIYKFLNSKIGKELKECKKINKEKEFILVDSKISNSQIQGIIDLYYINQNGNITLVDFKTDNLEEEEMFIQKYNIQLDIYKRALEKLTGISVEKTYIYSFKLGKEIEIKYE